MSVLLYSLCVPECNDRSICVLGSDTRPYCWQITAVKQRNNIIFRSLDVITADCSDGTSIRSNARTSHDPAVLNDDGMILWLNLCQLVGGSSKSNAGRIAMDLEVRIRETNAKRRLLTIFMRSEPVATWIIQPEEECNQQHSENHEKEGEVASLHPSSVRMLLSRKGPPDSGVQEKGCSWTRVSRIFLFVSANGCPSCVVVSGAWKKGSLHERLVNFSGPTLSDPHPSSCNPQQQSKLGARRNVCRCLQNGLCKEGIVLIPATSLLLSLGSDECCGDQD